MILRNDEIVVEIITDPKERKIHERMIEILEQEEKLAQEARQRMDALQHAEIEQARPIRRFKSITGV
jgi:hypothetical protein